MEVSSKAASKCFMFMYFLQPHWARHAAGTDQHQGDKFVVPSLCGTDVEVHQAVNQGRKRYIAHIAQT